MQHAAGATPLVIVFLIPIAAFAMVVLLGWLETRKKEKEITQRHELLRKIAESQDAAAQRVLEMLREQDYEAQIRRREGMKLGGLITSAVGIALMPFLYFIVREKPVWIVGAIPLLVGVALMVYVFLLSSNPSRKDRELP